MYYKHKKGYCFDLQQHTCLLYFFHFCSLSEPNTQFNKKVFIFPLFNWNLLFSTKQSCWDTCWALIISILFLIIIQFIPDYKFWFWFSTKFWTGKFQFSMNHEHNTSKMMTLADLSIQYILSFCWKIHRYQNLVQISTCKKYSQR